jgi:hypothetical protein
LLASCRSMTKISGSLSGSISQRHGSADPDPDPHQNVMIRNTAFNASLAVYWKGAENWPDCVCIIHFLTCAILQIANLQFVVVNPQIANMQFKSADFKWTHFSS